MLVQCRPQCGAFWVVLQDLRAGIGSPSTSLPRRRASDLRQQAERASHIRAQPGGKRERQILCCGLEKGTHSGTQGPNGWASNAATRLRW